MYKAHIVFGIVMKIYLVLCRDSANPHSLFILVEICLAYLKQNEPAQHPPKK